jgi:outer membrane protein assembly factor BamB
MRRTRSEDICLPSLSKRAVASVLVAAAFTAISATAYGQPAQKSVDWPQFRFDDHHTGYNKFESTISPKNAKFLFPKWKSRLGEPVYKSSPTVVNGVVYIGSQDGTLWAYSADGCGTDICTRPLWKSINLWQVIDTPTVADGIVYVGSQTSFHSNNGKLNAFAADGCGQPVCEPLWRGDLGNFPPQQASATVSDGVLYIMSVDGTLNVFNSAGCGQALCEPIWTGKAGSNSESTPTVYRGVVYVGGDNETQDDGSLYAFKAKGCGRAVCEPLWSGPVGSAVFDSTPAISNGVVYIVGQHSLSAFGAKGCGASKCAALWQGVENDIDFFAGSPAVGGGYVYVSFESGIDVFSADGCGNAKCNKLWLLFGEGEQVGIEGSPALANGVVYAGRNSGQIFAWKAKPCGSIQCDPIWENFTEGHLVDSSPTVVNGKLYIGGEDVSDRIGLLYEYQLFQ